MAFGLRKVLISDNVDQKCLDILQQNGIEAVKKVKLPREEFLAEIGQYDGLIVRSETKVTAEVIAAASQLKIIGRAGTGVDNIDCNAATRKGIIVMNTPGGNTLSAAELTCTLLLSMSRHVSQGAQTLREGLWERAKLKGNEVYGKTLGIIGLGRIGKEVATRMQAFGMKTIGYDPVIPADVTAKFGVESMDLEKLWPQVDYVTVHTPLIPQTRNLINDDVFRKCKKGVRIINCARGGIIDEDALLRALDSGMCAGAALDVFCEEPPTGNPLLKHPLVTCTPHLGASTHEAQLRVAEEIAQQFVDLSMGKSLFGAINASAMTTALRPETSPWISLGMGLGKVMTSLAGNITHESTVIVKTEGASLKSAGYLKAAVLMGLLANRNGTLNLISAPALGNELDIKIASEHCDCPPCDGCPPLVTLCVQQPALGIFQVSGTVGAGKALLMEIQGSKFPFGVNLHDSLILYRSPKEKISAILAALALEDIVSYQTSCSGDKSVWAGVQVAQPISEKSTEMVAKESDCLYCIAF